MNRLILLLTMAIFCGSPVKGQFRVGFGLGYAHEFSSSSAGPLLSLEPAFKINNNVLIALRWEAALVNKELVMLVPSGNFSSAADMTIRSTMLAVQYYFEGEEFRPFVGLGFGSYSIIPGDFFYSYSGYKQLGANLRIGFDAGHFTGGLEFNLIPSSVIPSFTANEVNNSYFSFRIGFFMGRPG